MRTSLLGVLAMAMLSNACGAQGSEAPAGGAAGTSTGGAGSGGSLPAGGSSATSGGGGAGTAGSSSTASGGASQAGAGGVVNSGGNAGGPAHVVGDCQGLGAIDEFQNITPAEADLTGQGITNVLVDPVHSGTIFVGTDKKGLFKSTNCGADWTKVNTGTNGALLDTGILWSIAQDPVDTDVLYAGSLYGTDASLFKSTNGGVDWWSLFPPGSEVANTVDYNFFQDLSLEPTNPAHIVVTFHANCQGEYGPQCMAESTDAGETWRIFKGPLGGWTEGAAPTVLGPTSWLLGSFQNGIFITTDSGDSWEQVGPGCYHNLYRAADGRYYAGSDYGINRSPDAHDWSVVPNTPHGGIYGDGKRLFLSGNGSDPYFTSDDDDGNTWTPLASPAGMRTAYFGYDPDHRLMYFASMQSGLYRMVTQ